MRVTAEEARDRAELRALVDAYATAADARDEAGFLALFLPDATLTVVQGDAELLRCEGRERLPAAIAPLDQYIATVHLMANHTVTLEADRARGAVTCLANHLREAGDGVENLLMTVAYADTYARDADGWRFATREVRLLWTEVRPASIAPLAL